MAKVVELMKNTAIAYSRRKKMVAAIESRQYAERMLTHYFFILDCMKHYKMPF
jgi:hypothetical protein